jgi:hypothetical protein
MRIIRDLRCWQVGGSGMTMTNFLRSTALVITHQVISTLGVLIISGELVFTVCAFARFFYPSIPPRLASKLLTEIPGFPVQAAIGLLLGFVLAKFLRRWVMPRVMVWMWVLPLALFCLAAVFPPMNGGSLFAHYGGNTAPTNRLLSALSYSFPFVAAAAYSVGTKLAGGISRSAQ